MSLIATRAQSFRARAPQFDKNMMRMGEYGALNFFVSETENGNGILSDDLIEKARISVGNTVQVPVLTHDGVVNVGNTRVCTIVDDLNTSALYTITFATYSVGFTATPALHINNGIDFKRDFDRSLKKVTRALANALDLGAVAALEAAKTQVFKDTLVYSEVADVLEVPYDQRTEILGDLHTIMRANDYPGELHVIGNMGIDSLINKLAQHGLYNDVNKQLEYQNKVFHFTTNITNEAGVFATAFAAESGNVGYLTRSGRENLLRTKLVGEDKEWDTINMPLINIPVDTYFYKTSRNNSALAGEASADMDCTVTEFYGFAVDIAFVTSYNSAPATVANPFVKFEIQSPVGNPMARPVVVVNSETNPVFTSEVV